jgi:hypothetical protein
MSLFGRRVEVVGPPVTTEFARLLERPTGSAIETTPESVVGLFSKIGLESPAAWSAMARNYLVSSGAVEYDYNKACDWLDSKFGAEARRDQYWNCMSWGWSPVLDGDLDVQDENRPTDTRTKRCRDYVFRRTYPEAIPAHALNLVAGLQSAVPSTRFFVSDWIRESDKVQVFRDPFLLVTDTSMRARIICAVWDEPGW